jgi:MFS family permease
MTRLNRTSSGRTGLWLTLLALVLAVDFADQGLLSPLLNSLLRDFFGSSSDVVPLGWVVFVLTALSAAAMVTAGIFADKTSRRRIIAAGLFLMGAASCAAALSPGGRGGYAFFFATRALSGLGAGAIIPGVFSMASDLIKPERRATVFGVLSVAMLAGRMAGFGLGGVFETRWRLAYLILGWVPLALAPCLLALREPRRGARENELQTALLTGAEYRFRISKKDVRYLWATRSNFWLIVNFIDAFPGSIVLFLIFKYMKEQHNLNAAGVNATILAVAVAGALGALVFGRIGDWGFRRDKRAKVWTALLCNAVPIVFMVLFLGSRVRVPDEAGLAGSFAAPGMIGLVLTISAAMFVNQGVNPNWYASLTDVNLPEHRATMISLASVMDMAGNALGPLVASYIATAYSLKTAMGSVVVFWVANIFLWWPVLRHIRGDLAAVHRRLDERAAALASEGANLGR